MGLSSHCNESASSSFFVKNKSENVDLDTDTSLVVDISDALSERDKVKFTVHTKVSVTLFPTLKDVDSILLIKMTFSDQPGGVPAA